MMIEFFLPIFWMSLAINGNFMSSTSNLFAKSLSALVIIAGLQSTGCKYLAKLYLKYPLLSIFLMIIKPFLEWSNSFANLIQLLPAKRSYFEILILLSMTESIIQPEPCSRDFCMFDIKVL